MPRSYGVDVMKMLIILMILIIVLSASAQGGRSIEVSGGVSTLSLGDGSTRWPAGWSAAFATDVRSKISIVAAFSGASVGSDYVRPVGVHFCLQGPCNGGYHYIPAIRAREYLFGPRFRLEVNNSYAVFAQALVGAKNRAIDGDSHTGIGIGLGGGVDRRLTARFAGRFFGNWLPGRVQGDWVHSTQLGVGIVFRSGS
jgi:hypothetical protein